MGEERERSLQAQYVLEGVLLFAVALVDETDQCRAKPVHEHDTHGWRQTGMLIARNNATQTRRQRLRVR